MINVLITGDFCPVNRIQDYVVRKDFSNIYNDLLPLIRDTDIAITNLECPLTEVTQGIAKTGPRLKAQISSIAAIHFGGFNLVTLANNHIMDFAAEGLESTLESCKNYGIDVVGVGININEARKPFFKTIKNNIIAIVNFCENEWSTTEGDNHGASPLNPVTNYYDIRKAKENADYVFVIVHGGHEHYQLPSPKTQETYRFFIDAGADAVVGHHSHCFSGYEIYNNKPIFYSLGNFIFDWPNKRNSLWNTGYAVQFIIEGVDIKFILHPYVQGNETPGVRRMNEVELKGFKSDISKLNEQIANEQILRDRFTAFRKLKKSVYLSYLEPYSNKLLVRLFRKGLFPSLVSRQRKMIFLNIIRCEAHKEMLIETIKDELHPL